MKKGFTLIEILVVVIIISTLTSIAVPLFIRTIEKFRFVEATQVMHEIRKAQEEALLRKGKYTENFKDLNVDIYDKNNNLCDSTNCELKYFTIHIKVVGNTYKIFAQRKSDITPPPSRYSQNYIYIYDSVNNSFTCNDANCVTDFVN